MLQLAEIEDEGFLYFILFGFLLLLFKVMIFLIVLVLVLVKYHNPEREELWKRIQQQT